MRKLLAVTRATSNAMSVAAGFILVIMMAITFLDIVMRFFRKPIMGAYELVAFMGVAVTAFALPRASMIKTHVYVDIVIDKLPRFARRTLRVLTRIAVLLMFSFAAWYFVLMAKNFIASKTVTMTLRVPLYPVVFALAAGSIVQCLISICEIFNERGGTGE